MLLLMNIPGRRNVQSRPEARIKLFALVVPFTYFDFVLRRLKGRKLDHLLHAGSFCGLDHIDILPGLESDQEDPVHIAHGRDKSLGIIQVPYNSFNAGVQMSDLLLIAHQNTDGLAALLNMGISSLPICPVAPVIIM